MDSLYNTCIMVLLMQYISLAISCSSPYCTCRCEKNPPLKLIFQVVVHFEEVQSCGRKFTSSQSVSKDGVRIINYQGELKKNESGVDLCDCIHGYLSQKDWLDGSTKSCCIKKNIATMTLEGQPDPEFDNSSTETSLEQLEDTFSQFRYAEFENHRCRVGTEVDEADKIHFYIQCSLFPDSPSTDEFCKRIVRYLNQDNWLGELVYKCESDGKVLNMEILGEEE